MSLYLSATKQLMISSFVRCKTNSHLEIKFVWPFVSWCTQYYSSSFQYWQYVGILLFLLWNILVSNKDITEGLFEDKQVNTCAEIH